MSINDFIQQLQLSPATISFDTSIAVIAEHYHYTPTFFTNGLGDDQVYNNAGTNEGSCKLFAFGLLHDFTPEQMLNCFGDYYRVDVLQHPEGTDHGNIRNFMRHGWQGIQFDDQALSAK